MSEEATQTERKGPLFEYIRYSEFKRLLSQISAVLDRDGDKTVAVLSEYEGEGKSFFVSALALGYSILLNRRVLLVNTILQTQNRSLFFTNIFRDEALSYQSPGQLTPVSRSIDLLSPFQENPNDESDTSDFQLGAYVDSVKKNYDLVLFDTVALRTNNKGNMDPVIVARQVDRSILLISKQSGSRESVAGIKSRLKRWEIRLAGIVYNSGPPERR